MKALDRKVYLISFKMVIIATGMCYVVCLFRDKQFERIYIINKVQFFRLVVHETAGGLVLSTAMCSSTVSKAFGRVVKSDDKSSSSKI